jgi:hypothetical protein
MLIFQEGNIDDKHLEKKSEENSGSHEARSNSRLQEIALGAS